MARRTNGEGNIRKRADGKWEARVSLGWRLDPDGTLRRERTSVYADTQAEVVRKRDALLKARAAGVRDAKRETVASFLDDWLTQVYARNRPGTVKRAEQLIRKHINPRLGSRKLSSVTPMVVQAFLNDSLAAGTSPSTIRYSRVILGAAFKTAVLWGLVERNPVTPTAGPAIRRTQISPLLPDQVRAVLAATRDHQFGPLYQLTVATGLRQSEALGLRWQDVDLANGVLHVRQTIQPVTGAGPTAFDPKNSTSRRTIALPVIAVEALTEQQKRQLADQAAASQWSNPTGLVFTRNDGRPLYAAGTTRHLKASLEALGLPSSRSFHNLRHACASFLLAAGVPMKQIQEILGHSSIVTTANIYSHVPEAMAREAAARMEAMLRPPPDPQIAPPEIPPPA